MLFFSSLMMCFFPSILCKDFFCISHALFFYSVGILIRKDWIVSKRNFFERNKLRTWEKYCLWNVEWHDIILIETFCIIISYKIWHLIISENWSCLKHRKVDEDFGRKNWAKNNIYLSLLFHCYWFSFYQKVFFVFSWVKEFNLWKFFANKQGCEKSLF